MTSRCRTLSLPALFLLALAMLCLAPSPAAAVTMDAGQVSALLEVSATMKFLSGSGFNWAQSNLQNACNSPTAAPGIRSCNATGFPTKIVISSTSSTSYPLADAFSQLSALTSLSITFPANGSLPDSWSSLSQLTELILDKTQILGGIPDSWSGMTALQSLTIEFNGTNTEVSTPPSWLGNLKTIALTSVAWDSFPSSVLESTAMTTSVSLTNAVLSGSIPSASSPNTRLQTLIITNTSNAAISSFGSGRGLPTLSVFSALKTLTLSGLSFGGSMPSLPQSLTTFSVTSFPNLSGTMNAIFELPNLLSLEMANIPGLQGDISGPQNPSTSRLSTITLSNLPGLAGTISSSFGSMPRVTVLTLTGMPQLTGGIQGPVGTSDLPCVLVGVTISGLSKLGGSVPGGYTAVCPALVILVLDGNGFTGELPASLAASANNSRLSTLSISNNPTSGTIPANIALASNTAGLSISLYNAGLTGTIPVSLLTPTFGYSTFLLYGNFLELCGNANATAQKSFVTSGLNGARSTCNLQFQYPTECGCPTSWPTSCFPVRPMVADCGAIPPSYVTPYAPGTPYGYTAPQSSGDVPSGSPSTSPDAPVPQTPQAPQAPPAQVPTPSSNASRSTPVIIALIVIAMIAIGM